MKTADVRVGAVYVVRVGDRLAPVKLLKMVKKKKGEGGGGEGRGHWFHIVNLITGYKTVRPGPQSFLRPCDAACVRRLVDESRAKDAFRGAGEHVPPRAHLVKHALERALRGK